jgi:hypothetical protein
MAVQVPTRGAFSSGIPKQLFAEVGVTTQAGVIRDYGVTADGKQFVVVQKLGKATPMLMVVENWIREFGGKIDEIKQ